MKNNRIFLKIVLNVHDLKSLKISEYFYLIILFLVQETNSFYFCYRNSGNSAFIHPSGLRPDLLSSTIRSFSFFQSGEWMSAVWV